MALVFAYKCASLQARTGPWWTGRLACNGKVVSSIEQGE